MHRLRCKGVRIVFWAISRGIFRFRPIFRRYDKHIIPVSIGSHVKWTCTNEWLVAYPHHCYHTDILRRRNQMYHQSPFRWNFSHPLPTVRRDSTLQITILTSLWPVRILRRLELPLFLPPSLLLYNPSIGSFSN